MPFNRKFDEFEGDYIIDRTLTGPPPTPNTGTTVSDSGIVIADSANVAIPPSKTIPVTMPGPREPVLDASGIMAPRWRRFFEELYRRTGALEDNVNGLTDRELGGAGIAIDPIAISGIAPTVVQGIVKAPSTVSITATGQQADRTVA